MINNPYTICTVKSGLVNPVTKPLYRLKIDHTLLVRGRTATSNRVYLQT
jgi:hypothetical protein